MDIVCVMLIVFLSKGKLFIVLGVLVLGFYILAYRWFIMFNLRIHDATLMKIFKQNLQEFISFKILFVGSFWHDNLLILTDKFIVPSDNLFQQLRHILSFYALREVCTFVTALLSCLFNSFKLLLQNISGKQVIENILMLQLICQKILECFEE